MSLLKVSAVQSLTSASPNIALNADGTSTLAIIASGTAPAITTTGALWLDTSAPSAPILKVYNGVASAWIAPPGGAVPPSPFPPTSPVTGDIYYDTSVTPGVLKVYNGNAFVPVSTPPASITQPANPQTGTTWYDTGVTPPVLKVWNGSAWVASGGTQSTSAPTSPSTGQQWTDTSQVPPVLKMWNGSAWIPATVALSNTAPSGTLTIGQLWSDTNTVPSTLKTWNGTAWVPVQAAGGVAAGTSAPTSPTAGTLWSDTNTVPAILKTYDTGTSSFVPIGGQLGYGLAINGGATKVSITAQTGVPTVGTAANQAMTGSLYWDDTLGQLFIRYANGGSPVWVPAAPAGGGGGGSGTVTSIIAGSGLTGGTITSSGTIALDPTAVIAPSLLTTAGDIIYASAASTPARLGIGTTGQVLSVSAGGVPTWTSVSAGGVTSVTGTAPVASSGGATPAISITPGTARQLMQTNAGGTAAEFASNIDIPGTLDVTGVATFDAQAIHPLGSAAAPSVSFVGDTDTGIYSPSAGIVGIANNGTGNVFVDASGRFLVGTLGTGYDNQFVKTKSAADFTLAIRNNASATGTSASLTLQAATNDGTEAGKTIIRGVKDSTANGSELQFYTEPGAGGAPTEAMRINSAQQTLVGTTAAVAAGGPLQLGGGITFPATQVASTDPNTLDDYEEGTWTPVLGGGFTFSSATGTYTKIGNLVTGGFIASCPAMASGTGASISGLPYTPSPGTQSSGGFMVQTDYGSSDIMFKTAGGDLVPRNYSNSLITYTQLSNKGMQVAFFYYV